MLTASEIIDNVRAQIRANLATACAELQELDDTGVLPHGGVLRSYIEQLEPVDSRHGLSFITSLVSNEARAFVLRTIG